MLGPQPLAAAAAAAAAAEVVALARLRQTVEPRVPAEVDIQAVVVSIRKVVLAERVHWLLDTAMLLGVVWR